MGAVIVAGVIILTGTQVLLDGPFGLFDGLLKSLGGFFIWIILGFVSMPLGLSLRYVAGLLPFPPLPVAIGFGVAIAWVLIPVLNPTMAPPLSFASHLVGLLIVYSVAVIVGGVVWCAIEFKNEKPARDAA